MHISEGILTAGPLLSGGALCAAGTAIGLKGLDYDRMAEAGLLGAGFFIASLIHVPLGPGSVHLILNGIVGLLLGWGAFPVILTALFLQAIFFQFGGLTTLGVNTFIMAAPAVLCRCLLMRFIKKGGFATKAAAFSCGFMAVFLAAIIAAFFLVFSQEEFLSVARLLVIAHIPVMVIEGLFTLFMVLFLARVSPGFLYGDKGV